MNTMLSAFLFLAKTLIDLYVLVIILRILLRLASIDIFNPINHFVIRFTDRPLACIQKIIPHVRDFDIPAITLAILLKIIKVALIVFCFGKTPHIFGMILWAISDLLHQLCSLYFYLILFAALFSWFAHVYQTPITHVLFKLTRPLFEKARNIIPPLGGFDLSPIIILILFQLISNFIIDPFINLGVRLTFG